MASLLGLSLDKEKLNEITGNGLYTKGKTPYIKLTVSINDELDKFGNNASVSVEQTKEEREAKAPKTFVGNGKIFWHNQKISKVQDLDATDSKSGDDW